MSNSTKHQTLKIGYFADGPWAHQALWKIKSDSLLQVKFICARFDNPDLILKEYAEANQIPFLTHQFINSHDFLCKIKGYECDLFVSMSFNQIFKSELAELPRLRTINCHAGMLPFYRWRYILNWTLINDESNFGITVHYVDDGIDTGDILIQEAFEITDSDTYRTLLERAYAVCAELLFKAIIE